MSFIPFEDTRGYIPSEDLEGHLSDNTEQFRVTLAGAIADEKSAGIRQQRRSIQKLGKKSLKKMILRIFEAIDDGNLQDHQIAKDFGLSKATYSRFAGSRWAQSDTSIPDLWRNTWHYIF